MKIKLMRLIKGLAALPFTLPVIAAAQSANPDDQNTTAADMMNRQDNMLQGLLDSIWGGGTFTEQTPNLLGTLSGGVASLLGMAVLYIMAYKLFMYTLRTGMAGEGGGDQGPTRVSAFWSTCVPAIAFFLITPGLHPGAVSSGYAPVQYIAYNAMSTGISIADELALSGVKHFTGSNLTTDNNGAYLGSGGAASPISSVDTDAIFNHALGANACRMAANKDLEKSNREVVLQIKEVDSGQGRFTMVFSHDLVTKGAAAASPALNGFCGQIRLSAGDGVHSLAAENGLRKTKFDEDSRSISVFLKTLEPITENYDELQKMAQDYRAEGELEALIKHSKKTLADGIENNASDDQVKKWQDEIDNITSELADRASIEAGREGFLEGQTRMYTTAINKLNKDLTNTATKLVGEYENVAVDGVTFEEELSRRGIIVLGAQYWGVTQLSVRVREMARVDIDLLSATLHAEAGKNLFGFTTYEDVLDRGRMEQVINDVFYSAKPWKKNQVLTARGAGYKASKRDREGNEQEYENDQAVLSLHYLSQFLAFTTKGIIGTSDNLVVAVQNLGDFVGLTGWSLWWLTGPWNPFAGDADDSFVTRLIKTGSAAAVAGTTTVATGGAAAGAGMLATAAAAGGEFLRTLSVPMMLLGGFMSYYIPAIPAVFFFMAMFGILIIFIESQIALPIWTVMLCLTSGEEGWETSHMRQGLVLILGLLGRLAGTVIVFFMVILLLETAGPLFVALLLDVYLSVFSTSTAGPIGWLFMVGGVAVFAYQIIIRSFSLMTTLMDMIMQGLNSGHQTFGEQGDEDRGRTLVLAQMGRVGGRLDELTKALKTKPTGGDS